MKLRELVTPRTYLNKRMVEYIRHDASDEAQLVLLHQRATVEAWRDLGRSSDRIPFLARPYGGDFTEAEKDETLRSIDEPYEAEDES